MKIINRNQKCNLFCECDATLCRNKPMTIDEKINRKAGLEKISQALKNKESLLGPYPKWEDKLTEKLMKQKPIVI